MTSAIRACCTSGMRFLAPVFQRPDPRFQSIVTRAFSSALVPIKPASNLLLGAGWGKDGHYLNLSRSDTSFMHKLIASEHFKTLTLLTIPAQTLDQSAKDVHILFDALCQKHSEVDLYVSGFSNGMGGASLKLNKENAHGLAQTISIYNKSSTLSISICRP